MEYFIQLGIFLGLTSILALSLNLFVGFTGRISLAHAAFYGIGAYMSAILMTSYGFSFVSALIAGVTLTAVMSFLLAYLLDRVTGDEHLLISFAANVLIYSFFVNTPTLTRGTFGIPGIPRPEVLHTQLAPNLSFLFLIVSICGVTAFVAWLITSSAFGRVLRAIREDEETIRLFGYRTDQFKRFVFVVSAVFASIAGSFFASYLRYIEPSMFRAEESIALMVLIILGGLASHRGALVGALVLTLLPEVLRFVGFSAESAALLRQALFGSALVLLMLFRPQGLLGNYKL